MIIDIRFGTHPGQESLDYLAAKLPSRARLQYPPDSMELRIITMGHDVTAEVLQLMFSGTDMEFQRIEITPGTNPDRVRP